MVATAAHSLLFILYAVEVSWARLLLEPPSVFFPRTAHALAFKGGRGAHFSLPCSCSSASNHHITSLFGQFNPTDMSELDLNKGISGVQRCEVKKSQGFNEVCSETRRSQSPLSFSRASCARAEKSNSLEKAIYVCSSLLALVKTGEEEMGRGEDI